MGYFRKK